jgi:hypothetical protein
MSGRRDPSVRSRYAFALMLVAVAACADACVKPMLGNASGVVFLLDYSKSFAPYSAGDLAGLEKTTNAMIQLVTQGALRQPAKFLWAAFGDDGLQPLLPCGPARIFKQKLTVGVAVEDGSADIAVGARLETIQDLETWFDVCLSAVRATSQKPQQYTDVTGALKFGSDALDDISEQRVLIVFSDFLEDRVPQSQSTPLKLGASRVLLLWRPGLDDQKQSARTSRRVEQWQEVVTGAGASRVCTKIAHGLSEGEIASCLWN